MAYYTLSSSLSQSRAQPDLIVTRFVITTEWKTWAYYKACGPSLSKTKIGMIQKAKRSPLSHNLSTLSSFFYKKKKEEEEEKEEGGG